MCDCDRLEQELDLATEEYDLLVSFCAENDVGITLPNRSVKHAQILTRNIIQKAKERVQILTGSFPEFFIGYLRNDLDEILESKPDLNLDVIQVNTEELSEAAQRLSEKDNVTFYSVDPDFRPSVQKLIPHFCVADGAFYRKEDIHEVDKDFSVDPEIHAEANFNAHENAKALEDSFNYILSISNKVN